MDIIVIVEWLKANALSMFYFTFEISKSLCNILVTLLNTKSLKPFVLFRF